MITRILNVIAFCLVWGAAIAMSLMCWYLAFRGCVRLVRGG